MWMMKTKFIEAHLKVEKTVKPLAIELGKISIV